MIVGECRVESVSNEFSLVHALLREAKRILSDRMGCLDFLHYSVSLGRVLRPS